MSLQLSSQHAKKIDDELWQIYGKRLGGPELRQLAKLFKSKGLTDRLLKIFTPTLPKPRQYYREELEIKLAWIDKRPLAKLATQSKRGELGDAAFFYFEVFQTDRGISHRQARALIMQAKVAKEASQIAAPAVPVNPSKPSSQSSTAREFELLSQWGQFDLYKTSGSKTAIVSGISVSPSSLPPAHGWYMATPRVHPKGALAKAWQAPWMCGPAGINAPCEVTLGELLRSFFSFEAVTVGTGAVPEAGVNFRFDPSYMKTPIGNDWGRLCVEILRLCPTNQLPASLFGSSGPRRAIITTVLRSFPWTGDGEDRHNWLSIVHEWLRPRKMPVLLVVKMMYEGEAAASK